MSARFIQLRHIDDVVGCKITIPARQIDDALGSRMWPDEMSCRRWRPGQRNKCVSREYEAMDEGGYSLSHGRQGARYHEYRDDDKYDDNDYDNGDRTWSHNDGNAYNHRRLRNEVDQFEQYSNRENFHDRDRGYQ